MKLRKQVTTYEEVEVELPFFFCHYLDRSTIYGWVDKDQCLTVDEKDNGHGFEVEVEQRHADHYTCYLQHQYTSTKETFDAALERAKAWINSL